MVIETQPTHGDGLDVGQQDRESGQGCLDRPRGHRERPARSPRLRVRRPLLRHQRLTQAGRGPGASGDLNGGGRTSLSTTTA